MSWANKPHRAHAVAGLFNLGTSAFAHELDLRASDTNHRHFILSEQTKAARQKRSESAEEVALIDCIKAELEPSG
jgi:hypothetical protein